jgi:hypothetical protein
MTVSFSTPRRPVDVLPDAVIGVRGHALVEVPRRERRDAPTISPKPNPRAAPPASAETVARTLPAATMALTTASLQCGVRFSMDHINLVG